jgi:hypothetical protein
MSVCCLKQCAFCRSPIVSGQRWVREKIYDRLPPDRIFEDAVQSGAILGLQRSVRNTNRGDARKYQSHGA